MLFVNTCSVSDEEQMSGLVEGVKERFPQYEYSTVYLEEICNINNISNRLEAKEQSDREKLADFMSFFPSATSRADILGILRNRLIVQTARKHQCKAILWGDTATRLAERTLAETAKGRGYSIPWQISDGVSPFDIAFYYPLRDLLRKEITAFSASVDPPLISLIHQQPIELVPVSSKNNSLDELMIQYLTPVEENYPNIVANVVRTSEKLRAQTEIGKKQKCLLCDVYLINNTTFMGDMISAQDQPLVVEKLKDLIADDQDFESLCRGCAEALSIVK